ncbi:hypothetical protein BDV19DRAFT_354067 [Aspergillus venezuelensis]
MAERSSDVLLYEHCSGCFRAMHAVQGWDLLHFIFLARHAEHDVMGRGLDGFSWVASTFEMSSDEVSEAAVGIGIGTVVLFVWWGGIRAMFLLFSCNEEMYSFKRRFLKVMSVRRYY